MTNKLVSADAAELLTDGGVRRIYKVDSHIGEEEDRGAVGGAEGGGEEKGRAGEGEERESF